MLAIPVLAQGSPARAMCNVLKTFALIGALMLLSTGPLAAQSGTPAVKKPPLVPSKTPLIKVTPPPAKRVPGAGTLDPKALRTTITGALRFVDCNAGLGDVTVSAGGRTAPAQADPSDEFRFRYTITGLPAGTHAVTPQLAAGKCRGGAWTPATRSVRLDIASTVASQDFEYRVPRQTRRVGGPLLASLIQGAFAGTVIHLNNYGPRHGNSWHVPNDSFIRLGAGVGGGELRFSLTEVRAAAGRRYYVHDLNLDRLLVRPETGAIKMIFEFESVGTEVKGRCSDNITCFGASDDAAPDFEINSSRLEISLTPVRHATGGVTFGPVDARFFAAVDGRGLGELVEGIVERDTRTAIQNTARNSLDQPGVRDRVATALRPVLEGVRITGITAVRMDGRDLVIEFIPQ
jgi:hypothetical protein